MIRFAAPWLLAVGVPLVLFVLWRVRRLPVEHAGTRRRAIQGLMVIAAASAALALAGLEIGSRIDRMAVVFLLDRSRSVERAGEQGTAAEVEAMRAALEAMDRDDRAGLVVFGAEAATEVVPSPSPAIGARRASVPRDATDIAAAIRRALADLPAEHAGRIVLVSDGVETQGDALEAAASAASRGVTIDVVPIERAPSPEVAVDRVRLPETANPGEPVDLRVITRATRPTDVRVRVTRDGEVIAEAETRVGEGHDVLQMRDIAPEAGVHRYDVLVEPLADAADSSRENNEGGAFVRVLGGSKVLVLTGEPDQASALAAAIRRSGLEVDVTGAAGAPADLATLASYDAVVLSDLSARALSERQMQHLKSYVRDLGGGLLMVGARNSFGLGGWAYTPVEEVLPATFDLRQRRDRASLAMIIAIDNSGSMGMEIAPGKTKLDAANEAAARSAMLLSPFDRVGVLHVDTVATWTLPMTPVRDPRGVAAAIRRAQPGGGGIDVDVAMEAAYPALRGETTQLKHFLLFADGADSQNLERTRSMVDNAIRNRITTSIVSMGNGPYTPELERQSRIGEGRFYIVDDLSELPRIFTQETIEASRSAIVEEPFAASPVEPGAATRGIDFASAPELAGYVVVNARPRATVLLAAKDEDPLLATWQHGIGRSAVLTTDAGAQLGRPWLGWPGYTALYGQLVRHIARSPERSDARVHVSLAGGSGRVRVEAVDAEGRYRNYLDLDATVAGPGGDPLQVQLTQTGAGRYEGTFDANAPGPYLVTVREGAQGADGTDTEGARDSPQANAEHPGGVRAEGAGGPRIPTEGATMVGSAGLVRPAGDELRGEGTDHAKLAQLAALTGGEIRADLARVFSDRPPPTWAHRPAWPYLIAGAIVMLLLSVALRRLVLPADLLARMLPAWVLPARLRRRRGAAAGSAALAASPITPAPGPAAAHAPAPEIARALSAQASDAGPPADRPMPHDAAEPSPGTAAPAAPASPSSLAETLLARKRSRR